jgi:hypothetical protein
MTMGDWFIQVHPVKGVAENAVYFVDFDAMLAFVRKFKKRIAAIFASSSFWRWFKRSAPNKMLPPCRITDRQWGEHE